MMGIKEKIARAKPTKWLTEGMSETEIKNTVNSAKASAKKIAKQKKERKV